MASKFNVKTVHKDGKSELTIGVDENAKTLDGVGDTLLIKNNDGSNAKIAKENMPFVPEDASEDNKLVTQSELKAMMKNIKEIIDSANELAKIVGGIDESNTNEKKGGN